MSTIFITSLVENVLFVCVIFSGLLLERLCKGVFEIRIYYQIPWKVCLKLCLLFVDKREPPTGREGVQRFLWLCEQNFWLHSTHGKWEKPEAFRISFVFLLKLKLINNSGRENKGIRFGNELLFWISPRIILMVWEATQTLERVFYPISKHLKLVFSTFFSCLEIGWHSLPRVRYTLSWSLQKLEMPT